MTYEYTVARGSRVYHIRRQGRIYTLCSGPPGLGVKVYDEPPVGKKPCAKCVRVKDEQSKSPVPAQNP